LLYDELGKNMIVTFLLNECILCEFLSTFISEPLPQV
jgi:hypothetical protein